MLARLASLACIGGKMIYIPEKEIEDWKELLADPDKQWKDGYSAKELAKYWHGKNEIPKEIHQLIHKGVNIPRDDIEIIFAIPEYKVDIPGGNRPSQNDLFLLLKTGASTGVMMIEAKCMESFGPIVGDWKNDEELNNGKKTRLDYLSKLLEINGKNIDKIRYQLLHRTASAIIMAKKIKCDFAIMAVQSFRFSEESFNDYTSFLELLALDARKNGICGPIIISGIPTYFCWIQIFYNGGM